MIPGKAFRFVYLVLCIWFASRVAIWLMEVSEAWDARDIAASTQELRSERDMAGAGRLDGPPRQAIGDTHARDMASLAYARSGPGALAPRFGHESGGEDSYSLMHANAAHSGADQAHGGIFDRPPEGGDMRPLDAGDARRARQADRWSLSAWFLYRPENGTASLASAGQLGASQAGARLAYDLSPSASYSLAVHARMTSALLSPAAAEAALGMTWRPARALPIAFSIERRIAVADGGRNAFAAYAAGGIGPAPLPGGFQMEGYAQAGVVGLSRTDPFVDGRIAVAHALFGAGRGNPVMAGIALSGGAQPFLSRLDIGPQLSARLPVGNSHVRMTLEWRERIAGSARPASGPALVLAADF